MVHFHKVLAVGCELKQLCQAAPLVRLQLLTASLQLRKRAQLIWTAPFPKREQLIRGGSQHTCRARVRLDLRPSLSWPPSGVKVVGCSLQQPNSAHHSKPAVQNRT